MPHASRLSDDGRFVAFSSWADNLAASDLVANDTNGTTDTFLSDRQTGTLECLSIEPTTTSRAGSTP